jgi:hypothetical protein
LYKPDHLGARAILKSKESKMTRTERELLRESINKVARHNKPAWWQLKREIWDYGSQSYYSAQDYFAAAIDRTLAKLPEDTKASLISEWQMNCPPRVDDGQDAIIGAYSAMIMEVIIARAEWAAYRTIHW